MVGISPSSHVPEPRRLHALTRRRWFTPVELLSIAICVAVISLVAIGALTDHSYTAFRASLHAKIPQVIATSYAAFLTPSPGPYSK